MTIVDRCEFRGRLGGAAVVVCPPGLADAALCRIGRAACRGEAGCTAWFWDDPALAPALPPTAEHPMSEEQAEAAVAIYIAASGRLWRAAPKELAPHDAALPPPPSAGRLPAAEAHEGCACEGGCGSA